MRLIKILIFQSHYFIFFIICFCLSYDLPLVISLCRPDKNGSYERSFISSPSHHQCLDLEEKSSSLLLILLHQYLFSRLISMGRFKLNLWVLWMGKENTFSFIENTLWTFPVSTSLTRSTCFVIIVLLLVTSG